MRECGCTNFATLFDENVWDKLFDENESSKSLIPTVEINFERSDFDPTVLHK